MKSERFEMRISAELLARVDDWRREQPDLPARAEAIRRLIELGLAADNASPKRQ
jgi:metal-responsive CopG/Arc/MetJ family transcriptional regulator